MGFGNWREIGDEKFNKICLKVIRRFRIGGLPSCEVQVTLQSGCHSPDSIYIHQKVLIILK